MLEKARLRNGAPGGWGLFDKTSCKEHKTMDSKTVVLDRCSILEPFEVTSEDQSTSKGSLRNGT